MNFNNDIDIKFTNYVKNKQKNKMAIPPEKKLTKKKSCKEEKKIVKLNYRLYIPKKNIE